jgi:hypothetical protein
MTLADRLGKTLDEILDITLEEYHLWIAYCKIDAERYKSMDEVKKR